MGGKQVQTIPLGSLVSHTHIWDLRQRSQLWEMAVTSHRQKQSLRQVLAFWTESQRPEVDASQQTNPPVCNRAATALLPTPLSWSGPPMPLAHRYNPLLVQKY